jgi:excisionase family DNA binding protein
MSKTLTSSAEAEWLDVDAVARALGVSAATVRRLAAGRSLGHHRFGGQIRVRPEDLDDYVNSSHLVRQQ